MPLEAGTKLGPYEVTAPIGAGGMGEVYRARDTKLNRDVALKVLPDAFVDEPERLARFQREAEVLASLNHPNIAQIYGLEDSSETTALVLELVEGPTLAGRIQQGAIPLDEALDIANQIADALEAAHAVGIIHRDLKPANIKITPDGVVKVLDFGLAKAFTTGESASPESSLSPTLTKGTALGVILGTAAYMSPEQAKGKSVDTRTDVWAFGAVLYEMLAGERAFKGEDISDTLVSVFRDDPDWAKLPGGTPPRITQAMRVCLNKDAKKRVRDIAAVRLALEGAFESVVTSDARPAMRSDISRGHRALTWTLVGLLVLTAGLTVRSLMRPRAKDATVSRLSFALPKTQARTNPGRRGVAVSPGGTHVVYVANRQLYLRAIDALDAEPLSGTEDRAPTVPLFSPDGQWVAFYSTRDGELQKVALTGGAAVSICAAENPYGASWSSDDTIVYGQSTSGIFRVPASGGTPELLVPLEDGERAQSPQMLADGRSVLFTVGQNDWDEAQIVVQRLDTGERRVLFRGGTDARYLESGHLVYALAENLLAVPFALDRLEIVGGPVPLVENVTPAMTTGGVNFDVSHGGTLVYQTGTAALRRTLAWVDRDGREEPIAAEPRHFITPRISPDGTEAVVGALDEEIDLWVWDFARETLTRLTFGPAYDGNPVWMPDGQSVIFSSDREGSRNLYRQAADGTGVAELLFERTGSQAPLFVTPDGTRLVLQDYTDERSDFLSLSLKGERVVETLLDTDSRVDNGQLSPDGRWLAYDSNASGAREVYVRPFPDVDSGGRWQISTGGGRKPLWGPDGRELCFWSDGVGLMHIATDTTKGFRPGNAERILEPGAYYVSPFDRSFDISPDGKRFLMIKEGGGSDDPYAGLTRFIVVQNWFEELKARVPN